MIPLDHFFSFVLHIHVLTNKVYLRSASDFAVIYSCSESLVTDINKVSLRYKCIQRLRQSIHYLTEHVKKGNKVFMCNQQRKQN